jgi:two-component system nitrogen regulation sensor histidine kinase NtrY
MSFRRKLLAVFALTIIVSVVAVAWIASAVTSRAFAKANEERTAAWIAQFRREFNRQGEDVLRRVQTLAASEPALRMGLALSHSSADYAAYVGEAKSAAESHELDFLEFLDSQGTIISSAQWSAKFGYMEGSVANLAQATSQDAFLKQEELPNGTVLGLFAVRVVNVGEKSVYAIGGRQLDKRFLASLELPPGMRVILYQNVGTGLPSQFASNPSVSAQEAYKLAPLIEIVRQHGEETSDIVRWSQDAAEDESVHAIPLKGQEGQLLGVLLVGNSRRTYVELNRRIRTAALMVAAGGVLLAILLSGWAAARVTRPVEQLATAAREVAGGNWNTQVEVNSADELGELAESFNRMTHELLQQRNQLLQTERVAAWRELARRLAHELKNPLFPLQLTVENLIRARQQSAEQFEEIFLESSSTLLAEIANLKAIISRFSDFSRMPHPQLQSVQFNEIVQGVARLFQAQLQSPNAPAIECKTELDEHLEPIAADAELLHRAISNLVLNAMDAMPQGGTLTLRTWQDGNSMYLEVSDTGPGLTSEECARLFTPDYTNKPHGTGLGLAIVQSVVSDHGGKISVQSSPGRGTTFRIELSRNIERFKLPAEQRSSAKV